jgi:hypothetical protein
MEFMDEFYIDWLFMIVYGWILIIDYHWLNLIGLTIADVWISDLDPFQS